MKTSLIKLILEESGNHTYGCAMLHFDATPLLKIQDAIKPEDVYKNDSGEGRKFGLEDNFHVTLLYGLHDGVSLQEVKAALKGIKFGPIVLHNLSKFDNPEYDVLKFDVRYHNKGENFLSKANESLKKLPYTSDFPTYHPHATVAYLKKGEAQKYIDKLKDYELQVIPDYAFYSTPDGTETKIEINK